MTHVLYVMKKSVWLGLTKIKETSEVFFGKEIQNVVIPVPSTVASSLFRSYFKATLLFSSIEILLWHRHYFVCQMVSTILRFFVQGNG